MKVRLRELLSLVNAMLWLHQSICNMASLSSPNSYTVSNNKYLNELDNFLPSFLSGELSVEEQIYFIQTVIDLDLQDRYQLHSECKYFVLEGMCYEVPIQWLIQFHQHITLLSLEDKYNSGPLHVVV